MFKTIARITTSISNRVTLTPEGMRRKLLEDCLRTEVESMALSENYAFLAKSEYARAQAARSTAARLRGELTMLSAAVTGDIAP